MLENLLINAIQHNKNEIPEILIKISKELQEGKDYMRIEFIDNGLGVIDSRKMEIFQREINEENTPSGIGLGLLLMKRVIKSYDGKIWVEDRIPGDYTKGSNFIVLIPENN